jgi:ornithine cyclodeaminase
MIYFDEKDLDQLDLNWSATIQTIEDAVKCLHINEFVQPIKPYLRFNDPKNRIIAMPAYLGGAFNKAGIKWIASFPKNIESQIPRAHSVLILNDATTGEPIMIINTPKLSVIRTASVSGLVIKYYLLKIKRGQLKVGIIGFGPIGQFHAKMICDQLAERVQEINVFDIQKTTVDHLDQNVKEKINIVDSWQEAYQQADILITSTVSSAPYIDLAPKSGSLHLNVSLRDYKVDTYDFFKSGIIVDSWDEVCRENTDIEMMHLHKGLSKSETNTLVDVTVDNVLENHPVEEPIFFNPMGMAIFDIAIGSYYYNCFQRKLNSQLVTTY